MIRMFQPELAGIRIEKIQAMPIIENKKWKNDCEDLTLEEAKQFDCCKDLTDDEIKELLEVLKVFTEIAYSVFAKKQAQAEIDKEQRKDEREEKKDYKTAA